MNKTINLFFIRDGYYECIVTTKEDISQKYDRKITVELEEAKEWDRGTYCSNIAAISMREHCLKEFNNEKHVYIDANKWLFDKRDYPLYIALEKKFTDGNEYHAKDLGLGIDGSSYMAFLFTEPDKTMQR